MASTYSPSLQITLIGTGDQAGTWGATTNTNLGTVIEQAITGSGSFACSGGADTLPAISPGVSSTARNIYLTLTGTGGGSVACPAVNKMYFVYNSTAGAITFKTAAGTGISVPAGSTYALYCNGTNVVNAISANSISGVVSANPTASLGLTAVNGSAATFMRSDAAPALDVSITPTWTGAHIWSSTVTFNGAASVTGTATFSNASVQFTSTTNPTINDGAGTQFAVGFRAIPQNATTGSAPTLGLADSGKHIYYTGATTITQTIPANSSVAYPVGTVLTFINDASAAVSINIAITTDTLVWAGNGTTGTRTLARYGIATATKVTSTRWIISGTGIS